MKCNTGGSIREGLLRGQEAKAFAWSIVIALDAGLEIRGGQGGEVGFTGEAYRARDTRLGRDVAVKVLPAAIAGDAERMARGKGEDHALASLSRRELAERTSQREGPAVRRVLTAATSIKPADCEGRERWLSSSPGSFRRSSSLCRRFSPR